MRLSRRSTQALLLAVLFVNLALLFPQGGHESGVDSFVWHGMATSIKANGRALWVINPLSYFGLYPLSNPSGSPFLVAILSDLSGISVEGSVLLTDVMLAVPALLLAFVLGWYIFRDEMLAILLACIQSLAPVLLGSLAWQMPTRIVFTMLLPMLLWTLMRLAQHPSAKTAALAGITFVTMMMFHRLTVLAILVCVAFVLVGIYIVAFRTLRIKKPAFFLNSRFKRSAPFLALGILATAAAVTIFATDTLQQYSEGVVFSGSSRLTELGNLAVSLTRSAGLLIPLLLLGVASMAFGRGKSFKEPFLLVAFLSFVPALFLRQYTGYYTVPFTSVFTALGLYVIVRMQTTTRRKTAVVGAAIAVLVVSSIVITDYNLDLLPTLSGNTYSAALYIHGYPRGGVVANDGLLGAQVDAISGCPYLPVGGATTPFQSPDILMFGYVDPAMVQQNVHPTPLSEINVDSDSTFYLDGVQAEADWVAILNSNVDSIRPSLVEQYRPGYLLARADVPQSFYAYGNYYPSTLLESAAASRYVVFENGQVILWDL